MPRSLKTLMTLSAAIGGATGYACSCVASGTRIRTPTGSSDVADLRLGDRVLSVDPLTGQTEVTTVTLIRTSLRECLALGIGTRRLVCTPDHPVYSPEQGDYVTASRFAEKLVRIVQVAVSEAWVQLAVDTIEIYVGVHRVFDIGVASPHHNYVADGIVVHNKSYSAYPQTRFLCEPRGPESEECPSRMRCCSDDPATVGGGIPSYGVMPPSDAAEPLFAGDGNRRSVTGMCAQRHWEREDVEEIDFSLGDCPRPCNPTWATDVIDAVCGEGVPCCQTRELTEADCIFDESIGRWRPMDGRDAEAAALRGAARWGEEGGTHQDPDFSGCEAVAGGRQGEAFLDCVRQLTVANQRGFCPTDLFDLWWTGEEDVTFEDDSECPESNITDVCDAMNDD